MSETCVFCAIVAGEAPASAVWADDAVVAFLDINPLTPGHVLVVPREHAASLAELDHALGGRLFAVIGATPVMQAILSTRITGNQYRDEVILETELLPLENAEYPATFVF